MAIEDNTGYQGVTISYDDTASERSTRVKEVRSISTPNRCLKFVYNADNTIQVKRFEGTQLIGTWTYNLMALGGGGGGSLIGLPIIYPLGSSALRLAEVTHANDPTTITRYEYYTEPGNLAELNGNAAQFGLIKRIVEPNGESHSYEYYLNGRIFRVTDGDGNQQSFNYNLFRNLTEFTDENGSVETYIYQDNGLLVKQIHNDRSRLEFTWGPPSTSSTVQYEEFLMKSSTDERGGKEEFTYRTFVPSNPLSRPGELQTSKSKHKITTTYAYDDSHAYISSVTSITETPESGTPLQTAQYTYDTYGHVLTATDADGHVTEYEYYDGAAPAHFRGLLKSETQPKGVAGSTEDVVWQTLIDSFEIAGDTLSVRLLSGDMSQSVVADAIRIDWIDEDGVFTRIIDANSAGDAGFRVIASGYGDYPTAAMYNNNYLQFSGMQGNLPLADWIFTDLEAGSYRISISWSPDNSPPSDPTTTYRVYAGLPGEGVVTQKLINQGAHPAGFSSFQTLFEYDTAGNLTRSITEGLPSGRRVYDSFGNVTYEEDATGAAFAYRYDALGRRVESRAMTAEHAEVLLDQSRSVESYYGPLSYTLDVDNTSWEILDGGCQTVGDWGRR